MPNQQSAGGSPFARYAGEQVNQLPEGYVQAMGQSPFNNFVQSAMSTYSNIKSLKAKSAENDIASRKVAAAEKANEIKEDSVDLERMFKAWEAGSKEYGAAGANMSEVGKTLLVQRDLLTKKLNEATDEGEKEMIKGQVLQNESDYNEHVNRLTSHYANPPPSFFRFMEQARPQKPQKVEPLSFAPQNGVTPSNTYGTVTKDVLLGGGIGGAQKKVTVQDGLVKSVTGATGVSKEIKSPIPESAIPALNEFLQVASASDELESPESEAAPEPTAPEPPVEIGATLKGELGYSFRHWATTKTVDKLSGKERPVSGTLTLDKSGDIVVNFDSNLLKPENASYATAINRYRTLNLMAEAMNTLAFEKIVPTKEETAAAIEMFSAPGVNDILMPDIAKAYALVQRNVSSPRGGSTDGRALIFGRDFEGRHSVFPNDYLVNGEQVDDVLLEPDATVLAAKRRKELFGKSVELASNPVEIPELYRGENPHNATVERISLQIEELTKTNPVSEEFQKQDSLKLRKLSEALAAAQAQQVSWENERKAAIAASKRVEDAQEQVRQEIKTTLDIEEGALKELRMADEVKDAVQSFVGLTKADKEMYTGYVAAGLEDATIGITRDIEVKGTEPRLGEKTVKDSTGRERRVVSDKVDAAEFLKEAIKGNNYKQIVVASGRGKLPDKDQRKLARESVLAFKSGVEPIKELYKSNESLVKEVRKNTVTGRAIVSLKKLTDTELNSLAESRGKLIAAIRTAMVGPGNPSNYEQEILANIVPDVAQLMSSPERNRLRLKALAIGSMLAHNHRMLQNGLKITDETIAYFTREFGEILERKITAKEFLAFADDYNTSRTYYTRQETNGGKGNSNLPADFAKRLMSRLEALEDETGK